VVLTWSASFKPAVILSLLSVAVVVRAVAVCQILSSVVWATTEAENSRVAARIEEARSIDADCCLSCRPAEGTDSAGSKVHRAEVILLRMMKTRREFLALSIGAVAATSLRAQIGHRRKLGLQLYTVRRQAEQDLPKTLAAVKAAGYEEVELYWNVYSHPSAELKRMLRDAGLTAPSGHFDYDGLDGKLEYARDVGVRYVICPMLPKQMWSSAKGFHDAADQFNRWGEKVRRLGLTFGFHNHNYEFKQFGTQTGFDILMKNTDPATVKLEMDCYWVTQAGRDPLAILDEYKDRVRMLHLKDRKPGFPPSTTLDKSAEHFAEFGTGSIKWKPILEKASSVGVEHYFVEQDETERPVMESIHISAENAKKLL
jgi:sugar phosphate isomerase/epimerase